MGGKSETALRECLVKRHPRNAYVLTNKLSTHFFNKQEQIRPLFEGQLAACGVDYFDFYLMHAQSAEIYTKFKGCKAYETALELKQEGKIKHFGISFHDKAAVLKQILTEYPQIEVVQIQFNYADYEDASVESRRYYEVCRKFDKPVIVMEPVKGGSLVNLPEQAQKILDALHGGSNASYAIRFAAGFEGIMMVLSGMGNMEMMQDNIGYMKNFVLLSDKEQEVWKMAITKFAKEYHDKMFPGYVSSFLETDPEFIERFDNFAFDEVAGHDDLDDKTRFMAILATLLGCQGTDEFHAMLPGALNFGVTPVEIKEIVYQAVAYLGIGRVFPFLKITNEVLKEKGIKLPLPSQATTAAENRREAGTQAQVDIFGEQMRDFWKSGPEESRHINYWLADNCFGDYYTRTGLDYKQREMITFCFLAAQGGCEPQLTSHAAANMRLGNDKEFLIKVISQSLPYIGYPRSLNALRCVNEAAKQ